jgi:hypothetical protein
MQFGEDASNWVEMPFLQVTTNEHEHERKREAPGEGLQ